jgi:hypothetical protein
LSQGDRSNLDRCFVARQGCSTLSTESEKQQWLTI